MYTLLLALIVVSLSIIVFVKRRTTSNKRIPPGPLCLPLIGSAWAFGINAKHLHITLTHLAKRWGPVYQLMLGNKPFVVISDSELIKEALGGSNPPILLRSSTKTLKMMDGKSMIFTDDRNHWAALRKQFTPMVHNMPCGTPIPQIIANEMDQLLTAIDKHVGHERGVHLNPLFSHFTRNVFLQILCRESWSFEKLTEDQKQYVINIERALSLLTSALEFIPPLDFLRNPARREIFKSFGSSSKYLSEMINARVKEGYPITEHNARDLLDVIILDMQSNTVVSIADLVATLSVVMVAGSYTVADSLDWMILFLCTYPEIQEKCHREIKTKLNGRTPVTDDQASLPYLDNVIKETFRMRPAAPLGILRVAERDCTISGYHISKDSIIATNFYGIGNSDLVFRDPSRFDPDRWDRNPELAQHLIHFGVGPTLCLGKPIAKQEMFLAAARLVQKYKFELSPSSPIPDFVGEFKLAFNPMEWHTRISLR